MFCFLKIGSSAYVKVELFLINICYYSNYPSIINKDMAKKIPYGLTDYVLLMTDINMHPMKR